MHEHTAAAPHQVVEWMGESVAGTRVGVCRLAVDASIGLEQLQLALGTVWQRHEALRSRLRVPATRRQPVLERDDAATPLIRTLPQAGDPEAAAQALQAGLMQMPQVTADWLGDALLVPCADGPTLLAWRHRAVLVDPESWLLLCEELAGELQGLAPASRLDFSEVAGWLETQCRPAVYPAPETSAWMGAAQAPAPRTQVQDGVGLGPLECVAAFLSVLLRFRVAGAPALDFSRSIRSIVGDQAGVGAYRIAVPVNIGVEPTMSVAQLMTALGEEPALAQPLDFDAPARPADAGLVWIDTPQATMGPLSVKGIDWMAGAVPVGLTCHRLGDRLQVQLYHDPQVVDGATAQALQQAFHCALQSLRHSSDCPLEDLPLSAVDALAAISTGPDVPGWQRPFLSLFEEQVARQPSAIAIESVGGERMLTYQQLDHYARCIAHDLKHRGVQRGDVVGVVLPRSVDCVAAILGVLKCAAVFMPIAPSLPTSRLQALLAGAGAAMAVGSVEALACDLCCEWLDIRQVGDQPWLATAEAVDPQDIAYILHTSGSSGLPKPVELTHGGLSNYLQYAARQYALAEGRGALVQSPVTFDLTLTALLGPLIVGQRLLLVDEGSQGHGAGAEVEQVCAQLRRGDITLLKATPSYLRLLNTLLPPEVLSGATRVLVVGGEALPYPVIEPWLRGSQPARVFNEYGPTETVVGCAWALIDGPWPDGAPAPIGGAIDNVQMSVRDRQCRALPVGAIGEICIAGRGVGLGYRGRAQESAQHFVAIPGDPGRLYRTGDRGRMRSDGTLDYLGRLDDQFKLNGMRIEPGEIERCLELAPGVKSAAVVKSCSAEGVESLTAFVSVEDEGTLELQALREHARNLLPAALVPARMAVLASLPLTGNGKIDRQALALKASQQPASPLPCSLEPAASPLEQRLLDIVMQVLGGVRIGVTDDLFDNGLDSIRSISIVGLAAREGLSLSVAQVFELRSIRALAAVVGIASDSVAGVEPFALLQACDRQALPATVVDAYPISQLQAAMIFHYELERDNAVYLDVFSYRLAFSPQLDTLREAARLLVARHEALRTTFAFTGYSEPLQLVHRQGADILVIEDLSRHDEEARQVLIDRAFNEEKERAFEIDELPLMRLRVQCLDRDTVQLTMSFHHAVIDGWSDVSLLMELFGLYRALLEQEPLPAAPVTRYADYMVLEQQALASAETRAFWQRYLEDAPSGVLGSSTRVPGGASAVQVHAVAIGADQAQRLRAISAAHSLPLKSLLFAVHLKVLSQFSGQADCLTSMVMTGRPEQADGEKLVGLFINSVPIKAQVGRASWLELGRLALQAEGEVMPHRRLPLARIQELNAGHRLSDTLFYFTHYHIASDLESLGVKLQALRAHEASSFKWVANFSVDPFDDSIKLTLATKGDALSEPERERMAALYAAALADLTETAQTAPDVPWQGEATAASDQPAPAMQTVIESIRQVIARVPTSKAVICGEQVLDYAELGKRAAWARARIRQQVGSGGRVAVLAPRSERYIAALLGTLEAGAIYVPLDPAHPAGRHQAILRDAQPGLIITDDPAAVPGWPHLTLDELLAPTAMPTQALPGPAPDDPAYLLYTSGSTGSPKGVLVSHKALASLFDAMTQRLGSIQGSTWLSLTSAGFDISLLELLYPLTAAASIVIHEGAQALLACTQPPSLPAVQFSLFFFASQPGPQAYGLMLEAARRADRLGFHAIWTPERHFHPFGGPFPNPAVSGAALAVATEHLQIRAGSLVLPLHDPLRVAEDWAMVDVLSNGRAGIAIASGWDQNDFLLAHGGPQSFAQRRERTVAAVDTLRALWRGQALTLDRGAGEQTVSTFPLPVRGTIPLWLSASSAAQTFEAAGHMGAGVLTHLLAQDTGALRDNIQRYRQAAAGSGTVSLMLHSFVAATRDEAEQVARGPLKRYLMSSVDLARSVFGPMVDSAREEDLDYLVDRGLERYMHSASLIGSVQDCVERARELVQIGVNEFACLIDFGIADAQVLHGLERLDQVRRELQPPAPAWADLSVAGLCARHGVTHLQCTPTILRELLSDTRSRAAIASLDTLLVGGEALPQHVADDLLQAARGRVFNVYGPTETTIWSSAWQLVPGAVRIGTALGNGAIYLLDANGRPAVEGQPGEICIGGQGLAEGYWRREAQTGSAFCRLSLHEGEAPIRLYRTGDLGRWDENGQLEFLGRQDRQVKVGGQRIELAEIEEQIRSVQGVADAACAIDDSGAIAALATVYPGGDVDVAKIRAHLQQTLTSSMQPLALGIGALPRNPNGKLDSAALIALACGARAQERAPQEPFVAHATAIADTHAQRIARIWEQTLLQPPERNDSDFFKSGGNSLRAMVMASHLSQELGSKVSVRTIFENPGFAGLVAALSQSPRQAPSPLEPPPVAKLWPASYSQERLWLVERILPDHAAYNDSMLLSMVGDVDRQRVVQALETLSARHDALRMTFEEHEGRVQARFNQQPALDFATLDLRDVDSSQRSLVALEHARREARLPFDLERGPLLRARLLRLGDQHHYLLVTVHHIVCDGWSLSIMLNEFSILLGDAPQDLAPSTFSYREHIAEERRRLTAERRSVLIDYWTRQLDDLPAPLELPLDFARSKVETFCGAVVNHVLPNRLLAKLDALAAAEGASTYMLLIAAVSVVLGRITGRRDIVLGTDVANRFSSLSGDAVGLFVNQMVLRSQWLGEHSFRQRIKVERTTILDALDHSDLPFNELIDALSPTRDLSRNPLFQVAFTYQEPMDYSQLQRSGPRLQRIPLDIGISRVDLEINVTRNAEGLSIDAIFNNRLQRRESIDQLLQALEVFLEQALDDPDAPVMQIELSSEADRRVLEGGLGSFTQDHGLGPVNQLLRTWASRTPDAMAIGDQEQSFNYRQLSEKVDALARGLAGQGIQRGSLVATWLKRDTTLVVAMLALWQLGAIYLPIDPEHPASRSREVLRKSRAQAVLTCEPLLDDIPALQWDGPLLVVERCQIDGAPLPLAQALEREPAYVLFTSGSTGAPKGAIVLHEGMINHLGAKISDLELGARDCLAQTAPQTFDISIWQFVAPLMVGGSVRVLDDDTVRDPGLLMQACDDWGITILETVPSFLELLLGLAQRRDTPPFADLRVMLSTGEALAVMLCRRWFALFPDIALLNAYGPTECSDDVTHHLMTQAPSDDQACIAIGRPIGNVRLYVLDENDRLCPPGAVGQLCVAGIAVGGGYLHDAQVTEKAFVADPFDPQSAHRLYRTGDLARWTPDGLLEYLGRIDNQVKIRGCRIELGEIETVLNREPLVKQSVVTVLEDDQQRKRLVAYVSPDWTHVEATLDQEMQSGREQEWRSVYNYFYENESAAVHGPVDPTFDTTGWNDSFTGLAIPAVQMRDWLDQALGRMRAFKPRRVLEIGCGTGMVLFGLAGDCERYVGLDFSEPVVQRLGALLATQRPDWQHVRLEHLAADQLARLDEVGFDLIVLNSVVQYLPSSTYLCSVLHQAVEKLAPGGRIYLGDLRSLPLQAAFHRALAASDGAQYPLDQLAAQADSAMVQDKELYLGNAFFARLMNEPWMAARSPGLITWLKSGAFDNELTRYRFDAALTFDARRAASSTVSLPWQAFADDVAGLETRLERLGNDSLEITGVPNRRLDADRQLAARMADENLPSMSAPGLDFFAQLADRHGLSLQSRFAVDEPFACDLLFQAEASSWAPAPGSGVGANEPLRNRAMQPIMQRLRQRLGEHLPDFMVPHSITVLDQLPLTLNGKIDRKALPKPLFGGLDGAQQVLEPRTRTEEVLSRIWQQVLGLSGVGLRDNFFSLGGDSILAIQIVAAAGREGLRLSPKQVFQHQTIAELAAVASLSQSTGQERAPDGPCPLAPVQAEFLDRDLPVPQHWNQSILLGAQQLGDEALLRRALEQVCQAHDALRLRFRRRGDNGWQQHYVGAAELFDLRVLQAGETLEQLGEALNAGFSLEQGPLLRAALQTGDQPRLLLIAHHLIIDGVSWRVLIDDLDQVLRNPQQRFAPARTASYRSWVERLVATAESRSLRDDLGYWMEQSRLGPAHPVAGAATGIAPGIQVLGGALSEELSARILQVGTGARIEEVLLTALLLALHQVSDWPDVVLASETHGRDLFEDLDVSRTLGWFSTPFVVRLRLPRAGGPAQALGAISGQLQRARTLAASYGVLRTYDPDPELRRSLASQPPAELAFTYFGRTSSATEGQRLWRVEGDTGAVRAAENGSETALEVSALVIDQRLSVFWTVELSRLDPQFVASVLALYPQVLASVLEVEGVDALDLSFTEDGVLAAALNELLDNATQD
ncbi:non-ribosomal peptide synthetase [Pseudomonas sessilinigenes]|uniref:Amino acid adenylation domain-containing protein n=1 Tax=Pseudomonas sessilinigenes TaxID=658629 RepID=A0ABX8MYV7_9PSED|nr:non-ribosomal peptide synthetase [Pseudomonas sessilinigenes]AZC24470.1 Long-chain-fatty-acid--CoA ligase [Pseudomonas sessilinigenes]QXH43406.1 amino acid adenylation domain-containing protein [Pseudomonas sessilinigenes]